MQKVRLITPCAGQLISLLGGSFNGKPIVLGNMSIEIEYIPEDMAHFELMHALLDEQNREWYVHRTEAFLNRLYPPPPTGNFWIYNLNTIA